MLGESLVRSYESGRRSAIFFAIFTRIPGTSTFALMRDPTHTSSGDARQWAPRLVVVPHAHFYGSQWRLQSASESTLKRLSCLVLLMLELIEVATAVYVGAARWGGGSVTGLIHRYVEPFDRDGVIRTMMGSRRWPRPGYLVALLRKCLGILPCMSCSSRPIAYLEGAVGR